MIDPSLQVVLLADVREHGVHKRKNATCVRRFVSVFGNSIQNTIESYSKVRARSISPTMLQTVEPSDGETSCPAQTCVEVYSPKNVSPLAIEFQVLRLAIVLRFADAVHCTDFAKIDVVYVGNADHVLLHRAASGRGTAANALLGIGREIRGWMEDGDRGVVKGEQQREEMMTAPAAEYSSSSSEVAAEIAAEIAVGINSSRSFTPLTTQRPMYG